MFDRLRVSARTATAVIIAATGITLATAGDLRAESPPPNRASPKIFDLAIVNDRVSVEGDTIRVKRGDYVELRWTSDRPVFVHLHGYDIERRVTPESAATMAFEADKAGRFRVSQHFHDARREHAILYLEVHP